MSTVVEFPKREQEDLIWRCSCGGLTHRVHVNGELECALCGEFTTEDNGEWRVNLPDAPDEPKETEAGDATVVSFDTPDLALKHALRSEDAERTAAIIILRNDGSTRTWGDFEEPDQAE